MKICNWKGIWAFSLGILGIPVASCELANKNGNYKTITVEGFKLQDTGASVYGGPANYITAAIYGKITSTTSQQPLQGIKISIYDEANLIFTAYTDESGTYYADSLSLWAGVGKSYTLIISDPDKNFSSVRKDITFETDEISKEINIDMESKN